MYLTMVFQYFESTLHTLVVAPSLRTNFGQAFRLSGAIFVKMVYAQNLNILVNPSILVNPKIALRGFYGTVLRQGMTTALTNSYHQLASS